MRCGLFRLLTGMTGSGTGSPRCQELRDPPLWGMQGLGITVAHCEDTVHFNGPRLWLWFDDDVVSRFIQSIDNQLSDYLTGILQAASTRPPSRPKSYPIFNDFFGFRPTSDSLRLNCICELPASSRTSTTTATTTATATTLASSMTHPESILFRLKHRHEHRHNGR